MSEISDEAELQMEHALEHLQRECQRVRTGRASPALVDHLQVDYYGTATPLHQIAGISVPEARMLVISPFDASALKDIEKAIQQSDLGITPSNDGKIIRLTLPELTGERRKELAKVVRGLAEESRVSIRNARRHANDALKKAGKSGDLPEDDAHKQQDAMQKMTDGFIGRVDDLLAKKEAEITEV